MKTPKCFMCEQEKEDLKRSDGWEMQHLHFEDAEIELLTCDKCKEISPLKIADKYFKERAANYIKLCSCSIDKEKGNKK